METHYWWWLAALILAIAELATGTFYLLVLGVGAGLGGLAALFGLGAIGQILIAAATAVAGALLVQRLAPAAGRRDEPPDANPDLLLDIGMPIRIDRWRSPTSTTAQYRGASWEIELEKQDASSEPAEPGQYEIRRVVGSRLVVGRIRPR